MYISAQIDNYMQDTFEFYTEQLWLPIYQVNTIDRIMKRVFISNDPDHISL